MRPSISYQMRNQSRDLFIEKYKAATYERLGDDLEASRVYWQLKDKVIRGSRLPLFRPCDET